MYNIVTVDTAGLGHFVLNYLKHITDFCPVLKDNFALYAKVLTKEKNKCNHILLTLFYS